MTDVTWNPAGDDDTSFGPLTAHNVLGGRTAADAHPAAAVSYDNDVSGLTGDTVQEAIDELATSGGAVASVNGETGVVVLDAGDVGAVPTARTITAGTGLTGGGDLSADRTLTVLYGTTASTAARGDDARLSDARTPTAHAASHGSAGSDPVAIDASQITSGTIAAARLQRVTPPAYPPSSSTSWHATAPGTSTGNGGLNVAYRMCWLPIELGARAYDRVGVTSTASGAGTTWEVALYDVTAAGLPGARVASFGTFDMSLPPADLDLTISHTPTRTGWWYVGIKVTAFTGTPTVRVAAATGPPPAMPGWPHRRSGDTFSGLMVTSGLAAGALPATAPAVGTVYGEMTFGPSLPIVYMRCA